MTRSPIKILLVSCLLSGMNSFVYGQSKTDDEFAVKQAETKLTEVIPTDSLPVSELLKRATLWMQSESARYKKTSGTTSGSKAEFIAAFPVKPKELNPEVDYTGKITMKVLIECKDSRFRYTVSEIRHVSKNGKANGGSVDNRVPECGSMIMNDNIWKKLKGEALHNASQVVTELKEAMSLYPDDTSRADEW